MFDSLLGIAQAKAHLSTISDTVVDQCGSAVAGPKVSITNVATGTVTQTTSNSAGSFPEVVQVSESEDGDVAFAVGGKSSLFLFENLTRGKVRKTR